MQNENFTLAEIITGSPKKRAGIVKECVDFPDCYGKPIQECYVSVFRFNNDLQLHTQKAKSVSGYKGKCRAIGLHFDFDSPFNDLAQIEARRFIEKLCSKDKYEMKIDDFRIFFSGAKGIHLFIKTPEFMELPAGEKIPETIKRYCTILAGEYSSFDRSVYDRTRIFRVINSKHPKSGLFKIPLFASELWTHSLDEIKEIAKKQRQLTNPKTVRSLINKNLTKEIFHG